MSRTVLTVILAAVVVLGGVAIVMRGAAPKSPAAPVATEQEAQGPGTNDAAIVYTAADVAAHDDADSCWSIIDGKVYDLTQWIAKHPGGERGILSLCGVDGSAAFNGQHGSFAQAKNALEGFAIGTISP